MRPPSPRIVALGLLTQADLDRLGEGFSRLYPVDETPCFGELLYAIDVADREIRQSAERQESKARGRTRPRRGCSPKAISCTRSISPATTSRRRERSPLWKATPTS